MSTTKTETMTIAGRSNGLYQTDLHWSSQVLKRRGERYWIETHCGPALRGADKEYLDRRDAIEWVSTEARDPITGYGYTSDQAEMMVDGTDAGKGYRKEEV